MSPPKDHLTPKQERFVQNLIAGMSQREAYRAAYSAEKMTNRAVDVAASRLLDNAKVSLRYEALQERAAQKAVWTREKAIDGLVHLNETSRAVLDKNVELSNGARLDRDAANAITATTEQLNRLHRFDQPEDTSEAHGWTADFAMLLAPSFVTMHRAVGLHTATDFWLKGGRGSTKSSAVSLEVVRLIMANEDLNAVVMRKIARTLRMSVYAQIRWAINTLGLDDEFDATVSPMEVTRKSTGQKIAFLGVDEPEKVKSYKPAKGYVGIHWYEETDQFTGMEEIRNVSQSLTRGGDEFWRFFSFNPPRSKSSWVNAEVETPADRKLVLSSDYRDVPIDWLGEQFIADAETLREVNETAYRHEYLGEAVGTDGDVFENVTVREITDDEIEALTWKRNGVDFGYATDPWVFLRGGYDSKKKIAYLFDETFGLRISDADAVERIKARLSEKDGSFIRRKPDNTVFSDVEPKSVASYNEAGLRTVEAKKFPGSRKASYRWLQTRAEIVIDPKRCPLAAAEFVQAQYPDDGNGNLIEDYPSKNDHAIDAARYLFSPLIASKKEL